MYIRTVIRDKVGRDFRIEEKKRVEKVTELDLERIAKECEKTIQETIIRKSAHPTGNLAWGFYAHKFAIKSWGIGDVQELDDKLPYWNHQDKGSEAIGANWRHWLPKSKWVDVRWVTSADGYYFMPSRPIPAKNYISETIQQMEVTIPQILAQGK